MDRSGKTALELSLIPATLAAGCCASYPLLVMLGLSFADFSWTEYAWHFRLGALLFLTLLLFVYFYVAGVRTWADYRKDRQSVWIIIVQTYGIALGLYLFFLVVIIPRLSATIGQTGCCSF